MKEEVQKKVEEALSSLDGLQRAEANPFLFSKIKNKLQHATEFIPQGLAWRMVAALVVIAIVNLFTLTHFNKRETQPSNGVESVASEYSISIPQTY